MKSAIGAFYLLLALHARDVHATVLGDPDVFSCSNIARLHVIVGLYWGWAGLNSSDGAGIGARNLLGSVDASTYKERPQ